MKARDVRAITFCAVTTLIVMAASAIVFHNVFASLGLTGAYATTILTRPRMLRVFRRLRDTPDWSGYYKNR